MKVNNQSSRTHPHVVVMTGPGKRLSLSHWKRIVTRFKIRLLSLMAYTLRFLDRFSITNSIFYLNIFLYHYISIYFKNVNGVQVILFKKLYISSSVHHFLYASILSPLYDMLKDNASTTCQTAYGF
jgi:hypothetical protein